MILLYIHFVVLSKFHLLIVHMYYSHMYTKHHPYRCIPKMHFHSRRPPLTSSYTSTCSPKSSWESFDSVHTQVLSTMHSPSVCSSGSSKSTSIRSVLSNCFHKMQMYCLPGATWYDSVHNPLEYHHMSNLRPLRRVWESGKTSCYSRAPTDHMYYLRIHRWYMLILCSCTRWCGTCRHRRSRLLRESAMPESTTRSLERECTRNRAKPTSRFHFRVGLYHYVQTYKLRCFARPIWYDEFHIRPCKQPYSCHSSAYHLLWQKASMHWP